MANSLTISNTIELLGAEGRDAEPHVAQALEGLRGHVEVLRVLGSFVAA